MKQTQKQLKQYNVFDRSRASDLIKNVKIESTVAQKNVADILRLYFARRFKQEIWVFFLDEDGIQAVEVQSPDDVFNLDGLPFLGYRVDDKDVRACGLFISIPNQHHVKRSSVAFYTARFRAEEKPDNTAGPKEAREDHFK